MWVSTPPCNVVPRVRARRGAATRTGKVRASEKEELKLQLTPQHCPLSLHPRPPHHQRQRTTILKSRRLRWCLGEQLRLQESTALMLAIHPTLQGTHAVRLLLARRAASARGRASKRQHVDTRLGGQRESGESASRGWCACRCTCKLRRASQCRSARQREGGGARADWAPQSTRQREHSLASQAHMRGGLESGKVTPAPPLRRRRM